MHHRLLAELLLSCFHRSVTLRQSHSWHFLGWPSPQKVCPSSMSLLKFGLLLSRKVTRFRGLVSERLPYSKRQAGRFGFVSATPYLSRNSKISYHSLESRQRKVVRRPKTLWAPHLTLSILLIYLVKLQKLHTQGLQARNYRPFWKLFLLSRSQLLLQVVGLVLCLQVWSKTVCILYSRT